MKWQYVLYLSISRWWRITIKWTEYTSLLNRTLTELQFKKNNTHFKLNIWHISLLTLPKISVRSLKFFEIFAESVIWSFLYHYKLTVFSMHASVLVTPLSLVFSLYIYVGAIHLMVDRSKNVHPLTQSLPVSWSSLSVWLS